MAPWQTLRQLWLTSPIILATMFLLFLSLFHTPVGAEEWKQDLTQEFSIGVTTTGYSRAVLDCEEKHMAFVITLTDNFEGVLYTRGSFHSKKGPCYLNVKSGKEFALKFGYDECQTKYDSDTGAHVNTVVVQHDDDLIFPGDLAFTLQCFMTKEVKVNATLAGVKSRIVLADPDPGSKVSTKDQLSASSQSPFVTLTPSKVSAPVLKEEL
ncbi:uncharacterized protein LOC143025613 [Oratosquilla oratoria]|uniref:uncharacterized protein LOC143025613 n=1 Tax=Oratosquilla oratoria TaxID=337810 RepID=UPI003F76DE6D